MPKKQHRKYGELKQQRSFMLTPTALEMLREMAEGRDVSINEMLEILIREVVRSGSSWAHMHDPLPLDQLDQSKVDLG